MSRPEKLFLGVVTRVRNEATNLRDFIPHYFEEGADRIILLDDRSTEPFPEVCSNSRVEIIRVNMKWTKYRDSKAAEAVFDRDRHRFEWLAYVDADEYVTTRSAPESTLRRELETTFSEVDVVHVPWVMFSSNGREKDPHSVRRELIHRWNHDCRHPHPNGWYKGRCRYQSIEVKSIFRPQHVLKTRTPHCVLPQRGVKFTCVDSIYVQERSPADPFMDPAPREVDLMRARLLCHHYRVLSRENAHKKCMARFELAGYTRADVDNLLLSDHADIVDQSLAKKADRRAASSKGGFSQER